MILSKISKTLSYTLIITLVINSLSFAKTVFVWDISTTTKTVLSGTNSIQNIDLTNGTTNNLFVDVIQTKNGGTGTAVLYNRTYIASGTTVNIPMYDKSITNLGIIVSTATTSFTLSNDRPSNTNIGGYISYR